MIDFINNVIWLKQQHYLLVPYHVGLEPLVLSRSAAKDTFLVGLVRRVGQQVSPTAGIRSRAREVVRAPAAEFHKF